MLYRFSALFLATFIGSALGSGSAGSYTALVGTSVSFYNAPICRQLGCVYQGVRRMHLEGSNNPVRIYRYSLRGQQQIEVTRYDLPGQPGHQRIFSVKYLRGTAENGMITAARLTSAAAGYPVTTAQIRPCLNNAATWVRQPRFIVTGGFEAPSVLCFSDGVRSGVLIQLTN
ncbi:hypothetical protein [Deinococcus sp.]|uniref:hypothetical protein n=1 Tax=Deinococcus sp. TaxID=47478 RepID=UPI003B58F402